MGSSSGLGAPPVGGAARTKLVTSLLVTDMGLAGLKGGARWPFCIGRARAEQAQHTSLGLQNISLPRK